MAASVVNKMIDEDVNPMPKLQVLVYPALQGFNFQTPSYLRFNGKTEPGTITSSSMVHFWVNYAFGNSKDVESYLRNAHISEIQRKSKTFSYTDNSHLPSKLRFDAENNFHTSDYDKELTNKSADVLTNRYFSPLLAPDEVLQRVPKTYILTVDFDPLRDDGFILKDRLTMLNIPVNHTHMVGCDHGLLTVDLYKEGQNQAFEDILEFLNESL